MNISCVICSECFIPASESYITPCGHMFHYKCLNQWLDRSKTCPQCRCKVTERSIFKVYFNLANTDNITDDVGTLQSKIENLQFDIKMKEKDLKDRKEKCRKMKSTNSDLRQEIMELENNARVTESAMHALKDQITYFKNKSKEVDKYKEEMFKLKNNMRDFENVQLAIKGTREEVNSILRNEKSIESLALLAATLKKSLLDGERKRRDIEHKLKQAQNDATSYRRSTMSYESENAELKKELEMLKANFAKEKQYLKAKLSQVSENPEGANNDSINRIMTESPVNYHRRPRLDQSDIICLDDTASPPVVEKVKKIVDADSPYLALKSGVLNYNSIIQANHKPGTSSTTNKTSIFRTASRSKDLKIPDSQDVGYDGFGGSSRDDVFPSPKPASTGLKRSKVSSGVSSKKFKRLGPPSKNTKISDYLDLCDLSSQE